MAHSIISDEINAGTLKESSWESSNIIKCQQFYSISSIEENVIRCKCLICPSNTIISAGHSSMSNLIVHIKVRNNNIINIHKVLYIYKLYI